MLKQLKYLLVAFLVHVCMVYLESQLPNESP